MTRTILLITIASLLCAGCAGNQSSPQQRGMTLGEALAQLDALPTPAGVSDAEFGALKDSFGDALVASGQTRFVARLPVNDSSQVDDLALSQTGANITLTWTYRNQGDYDQNSEANINDLTSLGSNLGAKSTDADWNEDGVGADGDRNGQVTISDITPLGANLLGSVDGYSLEATTDPGNQASWTTVAQVPFASSEIPAGSALRVFSHELSAPSVITYFRVLAISDSEFGPPSNEVSFDPGQAPDITSVTPVDGIEGTDVTFVPVIEDGTPTSYSWTFGGGATPDTSSAASPTVTLGTPGTYNASLTVSNGAGSDTFDFTLTVNPSATFQIVSVDPTTGQAGTPVQFTATINGDADTFTWDFGPGAVPSVSQEAAPTVLLGPPGTYPVTFYAENSLTSESDTFEFDLVVTPNTTPPTITDVQPQTGAAGASVQFNATTNGTPPDTWSWDFGGGATPNTSSEQSPTVTLGAVGDYNASLTISNANGNDTFNFTLSVTDPGQAPQIVSISPMDANDDTTFTFDVELSGGAPTTYEWEFTNGIFTTDSSTEFEPTVTTSSGFNIGFVKLHVENAAGFDDMTVPFTVNDAP